MRPTFPPSPSARSGFTLIEVLVAMVVMSLLAVMAWQGMDGIVRARDASQARLDQTLRINTVLAQWEQDLASLQDSQTVPALTFDGITLRLVRRTEHGLQLVAWSLRPAEQAGQQQLLRWTSTPVTSVRDLQDVWIRSQQFVGTEPGQLRTLTGVAQWQIYFYRNNSWSNAQSSGDVAQGDSAAAAPGKVVLSSTSNNGTSPSPLPQQQSQREALPTGVRMVVTFAEGSGLTGALTRDIALGPQWPNR